MASVKSLGLHQPAGLQFAIDEQLLPPDPSADSYSWKVIYDDKTDVSDEDELLVTESAVVWCRGHVVRKTFRFDLEKESITKALLTKFPAPDEGKDLENDTNPKHGTDHTEIPKRRLEKALVVFLKTQAHVYFLSGASHIVHMPFEVETAFAGPAGVLIQRKQSAANVTPFALRFPKVLPGSFLSSQLTDLTASQANDFSVEGLGKPKSLNLGQSATLETMFDVPIRRCDSHWPRLISLSDPMLDLGLVVTEPDTQPTKATRRDSRRPTFLDPGEELLHIEQLELSGREFQQIEEPLIIAVTINRHSNCYAIWRLKYLEHEDPFIKRKKTNNATQSAASRRRSSMPPPFTADNTTPGKPNARDSFGAPLPGKKQRKSERIEKPVDLVSSLEQQDKDGTGITRRSSRRLSSMLARADLSASHERSVFSEQQGAHGNVSTRKQDSLGGPHGRSSSNFSHQIRPSLSSLLEAPLDVGLNEGFHNMGLDDNEVECLPQDVVFTKVYTIPLDKSTVRYSAANDPSSHSKAFTLVAPAYSDDDMHRNQLLIGIQDLEERRLDIITLHLVLQSEARSKKRASGANHSSNALSIATGEHRRAQNVVDSCKLIDGAQSVILILSESMDGRHEISTQAPWSERTTITPPLVFVDDTRNLQYRGRLVDRDVKQRKSEVINLANGSIVGLRYPRQHGVVDMLDTTGRLHQLRIQLQPRCQQVCKVLRVCRNILQDALGERIHGGWLHIAQWLSQQEEPAHNTEWSAVVVLLFALVLNTGRRDEKSLPTSRLPVRKRRHASGSFGSVRASDDWRALEAGETESSFGCPVWMMNQGWKWALDTQDEDSAFLSHSDQSSTLKFTPKHIALAREYITSPLGIAAFGETGYMPTSLARADESRRRSVVDVFMALHLLLEEEKLNIMTAENVSPGRADLRVLLCQIARWLRWREFVGVYELGIQEEIDPKCDSGLYSTVPQWRWI